jgi:hypothetical protein
LYWSNILMILKYGLLKNTLLLTEASLSKYCQGMKNSFIWKKLGRWSVCWSLWSNYNEMFLPLWWRVDPHIWVVSFMRWKGVWYMCLVTEDVNGNLVLLFTLRYWLTDTLLLTEASLSKYCQGMKNSFIWKKRDRWRKVGMNCYYDTSNGWIDYDTPNMFLVICETYIL